MDPEIIDVITTLLPFIVTGLASFLVTMYTIRSRRGLEESQEIENYAAALQKQGEFAARLLDPLGKRITDLETRINTLRIDFEECKQKNSFFAEDVKQLRVEIEALRRENSRLSGRIRELEKENNQLHKTNIVLRERVRILEKDNGK